VFFAHPFPLWQVMTNVRARAAWRNDTVVPFGRFVFYSLFDLPTLIHDGCGYRMPR
jgi:hypothetical protein